MMPVTIQQIIELLPQSEHPLENSVDRLLYGDPQQSLQKVAVTFMANQEVLEQAVSLNIPFIITHESLYYGHQQSYPPETNNKLCLAREAFITNHGLALYRYHDHCHRHNPDILTRGLIHKLEWEAYIEEEQAAATIVSLPELTAEETISHVKLQLQLPHIRFVGSRSHTIKRIGILVGFRGNGATVIPLIEQHKLDAVIIGEGMEWEAPEYVRDSVKLGRPCALLILGHAESEIPGMEYIAQQLQAKLPAIEVHCLTSKPLYTVL